MNLVIDNTVEVNGEEKNDIGMVVSGFFFYHKINVVFSFDLIKKEMI